MVPLHVHDVDAAYLASHGVNRGEKLSCPLLHLLQAHVNNMDFQLDFCKKLGLTTSFSILLEMSVEHPLKQHILADCGLFLQAGQLHGEMYCSVC